MIEEVLGKEYFSEKRTPCHSVKCFALWRECCTEVHREKKEKHRREILCGTLCFLPIIKYPTRIMRSRGPGSRHANNIDGRCRIAASVSLWEML